MEGSPVSGGRLQHYGRGRAEKKQYASPIWFKGRKGHTVAQGKYMDD